MRNNTVKKLVSVGVLSSLAIVMGYLEQMIPLPVTFPGVKLGLSNICVILALYRLGYKEAFSVSLIKSLICGILFWGVGGMLYGVAGALLSFMVMALVYKTRLLGTVGISIAGALFHNIGQLIALFLLSGSFSFIYYLSVLGIAAVITGTITGIISIIIIERIGHIK
ncbi:MAG: Gx transporter family protein [Clostridia bacterium]|nr:Gx transporter family protein [Clostridia bacterium]